MNINIEIIPPRMDNFDADVVAEQSCLKINTNYIYTDEEFEEFINTLEKAFEEVKNLRK